jgi:excisionase family DNA binding protein
MTRQPDVAAQPSDSLAGVPSSKRPNPTFGVSLPAEFVDALADAVAERLQSAPAPAAEAQVDRSRLALSFTEAADSLGMSVDHFRRHVLPDLRVVRTGRLRLVPHAELDGWIDRHAARALEAVA